MITRQKKIIGLLFFIIMSSHVTAKDANNALYDPVAPDGSAFIRAINVSSGYITVKLSSKNESQKISSKSIGGYLFTPEGNITIDINGVKKDVTLKENDIISLVFNNNSITSIHDTPFKNKRKARANFYNLTDKKLSLKTSDGKHQLIDPITKSHRSHRDINGIKVKLSAFDESKKLIDFDKLLFKKGRSYSFVVYREGSVFSTLQYNDTIDPIL